MCCNDNSVIYLVFYMGPVWRLSLFKYKYSSDTALSTTKAMQVCHKMQQNKPLEYR